MLTVTVTQDDIDNGRRSDSRECPINKALKRAFPGRRTSVGADYYWIDGANFNFPPEAYEFRKNFDQGNPVSPFSFRHSEVLQ
jgi:hypothetical protein